MTFGPRGRHLQKELAKDNPAAADECYFFNSFFYKKLTEKGPRVRSPGGQPDPAQRAHERVKKWTKARPRRPKP